MQLKLCLLIAFVLNVSCVNIEKDPSALLDLFADVAPMPMNYSVKSPKDDLSSFAELFSSANPDVINQVIGLLETELSQANSALNTLTDRVTETFYNYNEANTDFIDAQETLQPQIDRLQDEIDRLQDLLKAAEDKAHNALGAYDIAQHDFNDQSPNLKDEKRALQEAIEKLRPLQVPWLKAVELSSNGATVVTNIGKDLFNKAFESCPVVQYSKNGQDTLAVYVRTSAIPSDFDAFAIFTDTWKNKNNILNRDFKLYNNFEDAAADVNSWSFCNYNDDDVGFPRDCGSTGAVGWRWFSMPGGRFTINTPAFFQIRRSNCPSPVAEN